MLNLKILKTAKKIISMVYTSESMQGKSWAKMINLILRDIKCKVWYFLNISVR